MAKGLKGEVLRGFLDHRTRIGRVYTTLVRDKQEELGPLPRSARPLLREWARVVIELDRSATELEKPSVRRQPVAYRRLKREVKVLRFTMMKIDQDLRRLAGTKHGLSDPLDAFFAGEDVAEAES